jgi:hypothetical protein
LKRSTLPRLPRRPNAAPPIGSLHLQRSGLRLLALLGACSLAHAAPRLLADEPAKPPEPPRVMMTLPLGGLPGQTLTVKARGLRLEGTTEVRSATPGVTVKFLKDGKAAVPANLNADETGDTVVEFELALAEDWNAATAPAVDLVFVAPHGEATYRMPLELAQHSLLEIEPNGGFQQSQLLQVGQVVLGQIERPQDVDVYALELVAGQRLRVELAAQRYGSALDGLLTFANATGVALASVDDIAGARDPRLGITVPADGKYFVVVQDANDFGGEAQAYRLSVLPAEPPVSFVREVAPVLQLRCAACHGPRKAEGGYRVDSYARLVQSGASGSAGFAAHQLDDSESFRRMASDDEAERMPAGGPALTADEVQLFRRWIEQGLAFDGKDRDGSLLSQMEPLQHPAAPEHYPARLPLTAVAFLPDGKELLVGGYHELLVVSAADGQLLRRIGNVAERTYAIAMHPAGGQFAVACGNPGQMGEVRLFDLAGNLLRVLALSGDVIHDLAFHPGGDRIAVAGSDATIRVYELATGSVQREIAHHLDWVLAVAWSPDGSKLASASRDKTAKVFNADSGELLASYSRHDAPVRGVMFHPSGEEVYTSGANQRWDRWKIEEAKLVCDMGTGGEAFKLAGAGSYFLVPSANNRVHLMKAQESDRIRELQGSGAARFLSVAAHEGADRVAAGTQSGEIVVWELSSGNKVAEFMALPREASAP